MKQNKFKLVSKEYLTIISGPCAIESEKTAMFAIFKKIYLSMISTLFTSLHSIKNRSS